jgi:hypothetical protein
MKKTSRFYFLSPARESAPPTAPKSARWTRPSDGPAQPNGDLSSGTPPCPARRMRASLWPLAHLAAPSLTSLFRPAAPLCSSPPQMYRSARLMLFFGSVGRILYDAKANAPANADMLHFRTIKDGFAYHVASEMILSLCLETMEIKELRSAHQNSLIIWMEPRACLLRFQIHRESETF